MNDLELQARLKSAPLPTRSGDYWDDFPARVRRQLNGTPLPSLAPPAWPAARRWTTGFVLAAALVLLVGVQLHALQLTVAALHQHERVIHTQLARLDAGMHELMINTCGLGEMLTDAN